MLKRVPTLKNADGLLLRFFLEEGEIYVNRLLNNY